MTGRARFAALCFYALSVAAACAQTMSAPAISPAGPTTIGGINSIAQVDHQWMQYIDTNGLPHLAQPGFADLATGTASCAQLPALTGNVTTTAGNCGTVIGTAVVTYAMIQNVAASRLWGNPNGSAAPGSEIALGATLSFVGSALQTGAGTGDVAWAANSFSTTLTTVNSNVGSFGSATQASQITVNAKGLVTAVANVTVTPALGSITGLGTGVPAALGNPAGGTGGFALNSQLASYLALAGGTMSGNLAMGNNAITGAVIAGASNTLTVRAASDITGQLPIANNCPGSSGASSTTFLRGDCTWATPTGSGNVSGPGSSTSLDCATFNGTSGTVIADLGGCPIVLASISALRANTSAIKTVYVQGYTSVSDGGEGVLNYVASDTTSTDNNCTVFVDASSHRFYRTAANGSVNVKWCGAKGDGSTTDTTAINEAIAIACNGNGTTSNPGHYVNGVAFFPPGNYVVDGGINVDNYSGGHIVGGCNLQGSGNTATVLQTKTGATNNILEIIGTSAVTVKDMWIRATTGTTVSNVVVVAASTTQPCNVIRFDNVSMDTLVNVSTVLTVYNCTEGLLVNSGETNYGTGTGIVTALMATNIYGASANSGSGATIFSGTGQAGGWNFLNNQIHDQSRASGTSTVVPLAVQGGSGPVDFFGGIVAGSVAAGTGGTITVESGSGALTNLAFHGTNFYADNGTQSAYVLYPNASVTGLVFDNCLLHASTAVMAAITGIQYINVHVSGSVLSSPVFAPPSGNNGALTSSFIEAQNYAINMGSSGTITHSVLVFPGTITGTQTSNGVF